MRVKKIYPEDWFHFKVLDAGKGVVEQFCAVFNNVDLIGDRVQVGFFKNAVAAQKAGGKFPIIYSHQWDNLDSWIGETIELEEVPPNDMRLPAKLRPFGALRSVWQAFMDEPDARKVVKLQDRGLLRQGSFAYDVFEEKRNPDGTNDLINGDLIELGPTLRGMNELTDTVGVKSLVKELDESMRAKDSASEGDKATATLSDTDQASGVSITLNGNALVDTTLDTTSATSTTVGFKIGSRHSSDDRKRLQSIRDHIHALLDDGEEAAQEAAPKARPGLEGLRAQFPDLSE